MRTLVAVLVVAGCSGGSKTPPVAPTPTPDPIAKRDMPPDPKPDPKPPAPPKPMTLADTGIVPAWMDRDADPCVDFYAYSCGGFMKTAVIPGDRSSWGAISIVNQETEEFLRKIAEGAVTKPTDPALAKVGKYYAACMDEAAIEKAGTTPIQYLLDIAATVKDGKTAAGAVVALHAEGVFPFFGIAPVQDFGDATKVIAALDQSGLGLPDRKYYLENTGTIPRTRKVYAAHLEKLFALLGDKDAKAAAAAAMRIETAVARLQQTDVVRRDPHAIYHKVDRVGLTGKIAPTFPWEDYLGKLGLAKVNDITVNEPKYYTAVAKLLETEKPAALQHYLVATILRQSANDLGKAWVEEAHTMAKELAGVKDIPPRWRRCVQRVDGDLGELLAQSYVKVKFAGDSKLRANDLTKAVLDAMNTQLDSLPWMDDATRGPAKAKLAKMAYLVGFPDKWRAYGFEISKDFATNVRAAAHWEQDRQLAKIGKPVDRFDWLMTPPTVNAYYDQSLNEMVLPAGQLQAPFFGATFHPAVNFGSTGGGTIGHEMTHGFDDEGSQFDADGNLRDWWSKSTKDKFNAATKCIVDQYAKYEAVPKVKLDGKLTAGENIADNGGVKIAYQAYQTWKTQQKTPPPAVVDGLTDDQLYFVGYGQSWCDKATPERLETMAHSNPHSPPKWRINGVIVNQPGFGAAFKCAKGAPMVSAKQCSVW